MKIFSCFILIVFTIIIFTGCKEDSIMGPIEEFRITFVTVSDDLSKERLQGVNVSLSAETVTGNIIYNSITGTDGRARFKVKRNEVIKRVEIFQDPYLSMCSDFNDNMKVFLKTAAYIQFSIRTTKVHLPEDTLRIVYHGDDCSGNEVIEFIGDCPDTLLTVHALPGEQYISWTIRENNLKKDSTAFYYLLSNYTTNVEIFY